MKLAYCPEWYCKKVKIRWMKLFRTAAAAFLIFLLAIFIDLDIYYNKISAAEERVKIQYNNMIAGSDIEKKPEKDAVAGIYFKFMNYAVDQKISIKSAVVEDETITAAIYIDGRSEYSKVIEKLEDMYKVVSSTPIHEEEEVMFFEIKVMEND